MDKHNIFNWNHVSEKLMENQISELKALYKFYHKKYWLAKMTFNYFKKQNSYATLHLFYW